MHNLYLIDDLVFRHVATLFVKVEKTILGSLRIDDFPEDDDVSTEEVVYAHALPDVALFRALS